MESEEQQLVNLLSLLESSYTCQDSSKLKEITQSIQYFQNDFNNYLNILFKGLSISNINNKEISLDLHKSMAINLKNIIIDKKSNMKGIQMFYILQKIFQLFFNTNSNPNLLNESIIKIFGDIIKVLSIEDIKPYLEKLFKILSQTITQESIQPIHFINTAKIVVKFSKGIFDANIIDKDKYFKIINDYYIIIIDTIFKNVPIFIDPNKNLYSDEYFILLNNLIDGMYCNLKIISKIENIDNNEFYKIIENIFQKYYLLIYELIKIQIPFDEESQKLFINQNPIIVFNACDKKCSNINYMKSKCFQFFTFVTEQLTCRKKINISNSSSIIKNEKLVEINAELIKLVISCLQDVLNNKEKYDLIKKPKEGLLNSDKSYNALSFNMVLLFLRCFSREPIKSEFATHTKYFILNIVFPLITSSEEEKYFLKNEPDTYQIYINDLLYDYKFRNFRTALCYLIRKICDNFVEMKPFILSYVIEMLNYIFNMGIKNEFYNNYFNCENKSLINNYNDEIKIDLCFLILLILKENLIQNVTIRNKFFSFFILNQDKIHLINSNLILIKLCKIYNEYISHFFQYLHQDNDVSTNKNFAEKMTNFLFNLIIQNKKENNLKEALISEASETILNLLKFVKNTSTKNSYMKDIVSEKIQLSFKSFVKLIDIFDNSSLNTVVSSIIEQIHINDRQDIINCLDNFTKKFMIIVNTDYNYLNEEDELKNKGLFITQYFIIIKNYLRAENKFDILNQNEINQFNKIILPVITCISQPQKYSFYEDIVNLGEYYIKAINCINEISIIILDNLYSLIKSDNILSGNYYSFISTFLCYINKNQNNKEFIDKIINIIKLTFSFSSQNVYEDILCTLLLIFQTLGFEGQINYETLKYIILENIKLLFSLFINISETELKEILLSCDRSSIDKIEQIVIANISLCFIYYPDITCKILNENLFQISGGEKNNFKDLSEFIIKIYSSIFNYSYYSNLGKCDILCLCSFFRNTTIFNNVFYDLNKKIILLKLLINFVIKHKEESIKIKTKITHDELKCDFISSDDEKSDKEFEIDEINVEDSEDEFDNHFFEIIQNCLKTHSIIVNSDEFKIFSETFYLVKSTDENLFNELSNSFNKNEIKIVNDLLYVRNIKVEINGKNIEVPRRTLKIKRNIH